MHAQRIEPSQAAQRLRGLSHMDPRGLASEADTLPMCEAGECWDVQSEQGGRAVVVIQRTPSGLLWIDAAAGQGGGDLTHTIDRLAASIGGQSIAFQTRRRGLVRRTEALGYHVAGYIMRKDL